MDTHGITNTTIAEHRQYGRRSTARVPLLAKLLMMLTRHRIRGETRLRVLVIDKLRLLRHVPVQIADWPTVFMDVRLPNVLELCVDGPLPDWNREIDEQLIMRRVVRAGDVAYDIGANLGLHTALLSRLVGPHGLVVAVEPNPAILPLLTRTVRNMPNAVLLRFALSDEIGESTLYVAEGSSEVASLGDWTGGTFGVVSTAVCQQRRLDDLLRSRVVPRPTFVKCDVEGAELRVFRGAVETLDSVEAPIVLFESNVYTSKPFGIGMSEARDFLAGLPRPHYTFFEVRSGGELASDGAFNRVHSNILAVPQAKLSRLAI